MKRVNQFVAAVCACLVIASPLNVSALGRYTRDDGKPALLVDTSGKTTTKKPTKKPSGKAVKNAAKFTVVDQNGKPVIGATISVSNKTKVNPTDAKGSTYYKGKALKKDKVTVRYKDKNGKKKQKTFKVSLTDAKIKAGKTNLKLKVVR